MQVLWFFTVKMRLDLTLHITFSAFYSSHNILYILAYKSKNLGQILALKARGSTYMRDKPGNNFCNSSVMSM